MMSTRDVAEIETSKAVIYAALAGNLLVAVTKLAAAVYTGSSSMFSEAVHSFVDTGNEGLLLYGYRRAARPADREHPLGYGRELYFWSFIVALLVFSVGAGVAIYQGVSHILDPHPVENVGVNYIVLALSALFEGASWWFALKRFGKPKDTGYLEAAIESKDPPSFMVLFEDTAALLGIAVAAAGIFLASTFEMPVFDGAASILIGIILAATAALIARESKALIIGESASDEFVDSVLSLAQDVCGIDTASATLTVHLGPSQIVVALSLEFDDDLKTPEIERRIAVLEKLIKQKHPEVVSLFVKPQTRKAFDQARAKRFAGQVPI